MPSTYRKNLPLVLYRIREEAGLSQEAMAQEIGVAVQTVRHWEQGLSVPRSDHKYAWITACRRSPGEVEDEIAHLRDSAPEDDRETAVMRSAMARYVQSQATPAFIRAAYAITFQLHREAIMQLFVAYLNLPLEMAFRHARSIWSDFKLARKKGLIRGRITPDEKALERAVSRGEAAALAGEDSYSMEG